MAAYRAVREAALSSDCACCPRRLSFRRLRKWRYQWKKPESGGGVCGGLVAATNELGGGACVEAPVGWMCTMCMVGES